MQDKEEFDEAEAMYLHWAKDLTPEESKREHDEAMKCADLIRKKGLTPNLDHPSS